MENNGYERFGTYLLSHLGIDNPDDLDWRYIINEYKKITVKSRPGLMYINWMVANHFGVEAYDVRTIKRKPTYTNPKNAAIYLATSLYKYTQADLCEFYSLKNHSSINFAVTTVENWLDTDKDFRIKVEQITNKLLGYEQIYQKPITSAIGISTSVPNTTYTSGNSVLINRDREVEGGD